MPPDPLRQIRRELRAVAEPARAEVMRRYFRTGPGEYGEGDVLLGVPVPASRRIARRFRALELDRVVELLGSEIHEERLVALVIMVERYRDPAARETIHSTYLAHADRVNNWDLVDLSAPTIVGRHLEAGSRDLLDRLIRSPLLWERRIALLATKHLIGDGEYEETLRLAEAVLDDDEDLIHKAAGWMLREVGKQDEQRMVRFVERHAAAMPRTMLRYAIERLPSEQRARLRRIGR